MRIWLTIFLLLAPYVVSAKLYITIIQGLGGTGDYSELFDEQTSNLRQAAEQLTGKDQVKIFTGEQANREKILAHFAKQQKLMTTEDRTALILIGHGSYDGHQYKFNIPGPDLTDEDLTSIMDGLPAGFQLLVNMSSASGAILEDLKSDSRIVITATRSGNERNATRFGIYFVEALTNRSADTNKNESISAEEAFEYANRQTQDFYKSEGRLATEHPQLQGHRAEKFNIARLVPAIEVSENSEMARLLQQRRDIDIRIGNLQLNKQELSNDEYLNALQTLILELSLLEEQIEQLDEAIKDE